MKPNPASRIQCKTTPRLQRCSTAGRTSRFVIAIALALGCFALSPTPNALGVSPPPDGGYLNNNTAEGNDALFNLTDGLENTAMGFEALYHNTTGDHNTANGSQALYWNETGNENTATGSGALLFNDSGSHNTATGRAALGYNTEGIANTATGESALLNNRTGSDNTATGILALFRNDTGDHNTANGSQALYWNETGNDNIALGFRAGQNLTTGDNNIDIGNEGVDGEANTIRIGTTGTQTNAYIAGINGVSITGAPVVVDAAGHLGTADISTLQGPPGPQGPQGPTGATGATGLQGPAGPITTASVVMLLVVNGTAPPAPTGYTFKGFTLLASKPNGGGQTTSYAVYGKD